jgi:chemotaxis methyl-accepting protein methylase
MPINSQQMDDLLDVVQKSTGMDLTGYRTPMLTRRLSERLERMSLEADQYISLCRSDETECANLGNAFAIHVSSFFRNPVVFEILAQSILPQLIEQTQGALRVWSAGCAAGEEAYSVAILIKEALKRNPGTEIHPLIFATDINRDILRKAERAVYTRESLKDTKLGWVDAWFSSLGAEFKLCDDVKKRVHFSVDDLLSPQTGVPAESIYGSFDLILCRNVLIYFSALHQEQVLKKLYDALAHGGVLVLGDSETLTGDLKSRFRTIDAKNKIYQK